MVKIENPNFNIKQIAISGQCFRMRELSDASFEIIALDKCVRALQQGDVITFDCSQAEWNGFWKDYFDIETDYGNIIRRIDPADAYLTAAAASCPGMRILRQDPWEMLVTFLISQQNNIPRITGSVHKICERYGKDMGGYHAFPLPEALAGLNDDALMEEGLGYRSKYVISCAGKVLSGEFTFPDVAGGCSYDKARESLLTLYGVGPKVADCICLFGLHLMDAFPIDTHIRQILKQHYPNGFPLEKYSGIAGILQQYMFYYDLHK